MWCKKRASPKLASYLIDGNLYWFCIIVRLMDDSEPCEDIMMLPPLIWGVPTQWR